MDFCKYHPLAGATHRCPKCIINQCDKCVEENVDHELARCFLCGCELESFGAANTVEPFWRRLPEAFRYPLNSSSLSLIIFTSVVSVLATLIPAGGIIAMLMHLFAAGSMLKYSFSCLMQTALGEMKAPGVTDAYQGGIKLLFQLVFMVIIVAMVVAAATRYFGNGVGGFTLVLAVFISPAILIRFAQTESVLEAINPLSAFGLIRAIGLAYGVLFAFMLIMMSSVGVLHEIIGQAFPTISTLLQSIVSNYYTLVIFHIMGYMLFQFQGSLGYIARDKESQVTRSDEELLSAKIEVFLKEGDYEQVVNLFYNAFKQYPNETIFFEKYFDFLYASKKPILMKDYGTDYLSFLIRKKRFDKLTSSYKHILFMAPDFVPTTADIRLQLAKLLRQQGDNKLAIKLLNGMHKVFPDFIGLVDAYQTLADALDELPGMQIQAAKCREWIVKHQEKIATQALQPKLTTTTTETTGFRQSVPEGPKGAKTQPGAKKTSLVLELVPMEPNEPAA